MNDVESENVEVALGRSSMSDVVVSSSSIWQAGGSALFQSTNI